MLGFAPNEQACAQVGWQDSHLHEDLLHLHIIGASLAT